MTKHNRFNPQKLHVHEIEERIRNSDYFKVANSLFDKNEMIFKYKKSNNQKFNGQIFELYKHSIWVTTKEVKEIKKVKLAYHNLVEEIGNESNLNAYDLSLPLDFDLRYDFAPDHGKWMEKTFVHYTTDGRM